MVVCGRNWNWHHYIPYMSFSNYIHKMIVNLALFEGGFFMFWGAKKSLSFLKYFWYLWYVFFGRIFDEFFWQIFWRIFLTKFLSKLLTNFLTNFFNKIFVEVFDKFFFFYPLRALGSEYLRSCFHLNFVLCRQK